MINPSFVFLGVFLLFIGGLSYLFDTLRGNVKPNKVTWFLWSVAPLTAFAAEVSQGVGIVSLATFITGFVPLLVFIASFYNKKAEWKLISFDFICGLFSVCGLILWLITKVGNLAILFSIFADGLAAVPTIIKTYHYPETESVFVYFSGLINAIIAVLAIGTWNFEHYAFPIYLIFLNLTVIACIKIPFSRKLT